MISSLPLSLSRRAKKKSVAGRRAFAIVAASTLCLGCVRLRAANDAYSPDATSGLFSNSFTLNTTTPTAGGASSPASGDALYFGAVTTGTTTLTNDLSGSTFAGFNFASGAAAFTIGGNAFTLSGAITNGSTSLQTINANIALAATQTVAATGDVTLGGIVSGTGFGLTKTGAGNLTLSGANTFTGTLGFGANASGTITLANASAVATGTNIAFGAFTGNTLAIATDSDTTVPIIGTNTGFAATIVSNRATAGAGINHTLGATSLGGGTLNVTAGANVTSGTASITLGATALSSGTGGAITVLNPTTANLIVASIIGSTGGNTSHVLNLDGTSAGNVITGTIANGTGTPNGPTSVNKTNTSTWTFNGTNTYTGLTTVSAGTLTGTSNVPLSAAASTLGGLTMNPATGVTATVNLTGTAPVIASLASSGAGTSRVVLGNTTTPAATALTVGGGGNLSGTFAGVISDLSATNAAAVGSLTTAGTGTLTLTGTNTYTGNTSLASGTLSVATIGNAGAAGNLGAGTTINFGSLAGSGTLVYTGAGETTSKTITLSSSAGTGTITDSGTGTLNFTSFAATGGGATAHVLTLQGSTAGIGQFSAPITDSTVGTFTTAVTKAGTGAWVLSGANTYTGATTISAGTLQIGNGGTTGSLSPSSAISNAGALVFNRTNAVVQGTDFSTAAITGAGTLTQAGTGSTLTLNTANSYTGVTTVGAAQNNSVLRATASGALGTGPVNLDPAGNASTARLEVAGGITLANLINFTSRNNVSVGIENVSGSNTLSGLVALGTGGAIYIVQSDAGTLAFTNTGTSTVVANKTITFQGAGNTSYAGVLAGGGALAKAGAGTLTLSGASTFTGGTTISGGILTATSNGALGGGNATVNASAISLTIGTGVTTPFSGTTATLTLQGGGTANVADVGYIDLTSGANITVAGLVLGATTEPAGTYSAASFPEYILGPGTITVSAVPEPGTLAAVAGGLAGMAAWLRRKRRAA